LLKKAGLAKKMKKEIERALKLGPDNVNVHFSLMQYYLAEKEYLSMVDANPENLILQYEIGYWYQRTKQYDKAFRIFETILKIVPEEMNAYYLTKQEYQITLSYDVSHEEAKKALKRLK